MEETVKTQLETLDKEYQEISNELANPQLLAEQEKLKMLLKKQKKLERITEKYRQLKELDKRIAESQELLSLEESPELLSLASEELNQQTADKDNLEKEITEILDKHNNPASELDEKEAIIEIRSGTGGDEASLFAGDLFRLYSNFAKKQNWKVETLSESKNELGGYKEIVLEISGENVYQHMKFESGVHRVQRIPQTEKQGRIHTSTVTVVVLPKAEETDVEIKNEDLRIDTFRASGAGGQHVNRTDSAVRITHLPTNIVVSCQDERSQHKNKAKAMSMLRSKLLVLNEEQKQNKLDEQRRSQIGTGERAEKIRTYNWPQDRITDHRIKNSCYGINKIFEDGDLDKILNEFKKQN